MRTPLFLLSFQFTLFSKGFTATLPTNLEGYTKGKKGAHWGNNNSNVVLPAYYQCNYCHYHLSASCVAVVDPISQYVIVYSEYNHLVTNNQIEWIEEIAEYTNLLGWMMT